MAGKLFGLKLGTLLVLAMALAAFLMQEFQAVSPIFGLSWAMVVYIGVAIYALLTFGLLRGASAGTRRILKLASVGLVAFAALSIFVLPALSIGPGAGIGGDAPTAQLTIAEGSVFDFTDFSTDGDGATSNAEIAINSDDLIVSLDVTGESDPGTLAPDSWAVDFTLRCTGGCSRVVDGALVETPYHARIVGLSGWVIDGNTTSVEIYEKNSDGTWMIAWTDTGSNTIVGFEDGGAMNLFADGESGTFTFSMYMNENGIPDGVADGGEKYTRSAIVEIFSPDGGTSFNVQIDLVLTVNT